MGYTWNTKPDCNKKQKNILSTKLYDLNEIKNT